MKDLTLMFRRFTGCFGLYLLAYVFCHIVTPHYRA